MIPRKFLSQALPRCDLCSFSSAPGSSIKSLHSQSVPKAAVLSNHYLHFSRAGPSSASSRHSISNTPKWNDESKAAVKNKFEAKYAERLKQKAKEQGFDDVEQLKQKALEQARLTNRAKDILSRPKSQKTPLNAISPNASAQKASQGAPQGHADQEQNSATAILKGQATPAKPSPSKSGVKPLSDLLDIPKILPQTPAAVAQIWNGYHQLLGVESRTLSAAIPFEIYAKMESIARKYPQFVVPLPREVIDDSGEKREGAEMHFLQWSFLPADEANPNVPPVSTVLYTPLGLYKSQQTFAQPHLILTHYMDLVPTHGLVLMRGDISESVSTSAADAQLLVLRLQQFYQDKHEQRAKLLRSFHEDQANFDVKELMDSVGKL